jgi:stage II sporulation protein D
MKVCGSILSRPGKLLAVVPVLLVLLLSGAGCGGKKRMPPALPPSGQVPPQPPAAKPEKPQPQEPRAAEKRQPAVPTTDGPNIRVLLLERFQTVTIGRSTTAPVVTASFENGKIILKAGEGADGHVLGEGSGFRLAAAEGVELEVAGAAYRGSLEVFVNPLLVPVVVNELPLEQYLRSVVPLELNPRRFPQVEAIKAQAVAARTFAISNLNAYASRGFDVFADHRSQAYGGRRVEEAGSDRALEETRGILAVYKKEPILALYSSTCGGRTEGYEFLFRRGEYPYLKGGMQCPDEDSPFHAWDVSIPASRIESNLAAGRKLGTLRNVKITRTTGAGRAIEMVIQGREGERTLQGYEIRSVLGLRSNYILKLSVSRDARQNIKEIKVKGKGWGHGVGMCQFGAVGMAAKGLSYDRILKRYYQGVELAKSY